jgi:hypothetical protein
MLENMAETLNLLCPPQRREVYCFGPVGQYVYKSVEHLLSAHCFDNYMYQYLLEHNDISYVDWL